MDIESTVSVSNETAIAQKSVDLDVESSVVVPSETSAAVRAKSYSLYSTLTFVALLVGYGGYYLCRQNLGLAYVSMKESLGIDAIQFGWINTIGTAAYGLGKLTCGSIADSKIGGKRIFFVGLFGSASLCFIFGFGKTLPFFIIVWTASRFLQSSGWSGLVNVMTQWFPRRTYGTAMGFMSLSYQFGGVVVALYCSYLIARGGNWQTLFFVPAITLVLIGLMIYPFLRQKPEDVGLTMPASRGEETKLSAVEERPTKYKERFLTLVSNRAFVAMLSLSLILTFLRECFNIWMPAYFSQMGASASVAGFKSTLFPLFGCLGTLIGGWSSDRYLSGRRAPVMAALMLVLVFCLIGLGNVETVSAFVQSYWSGCTPSRLSMILVGACGFFLLGSYSFVSGVVALDFGGKKVAGTAAGLLDGVGYMGATVAGVCIAKLITHSGWNRTFESLAGCVIAGIFVCMFLWNRELVGRGHAQ